MLRGLDVHVNRRQPPSELLRAGGDRGGRVPGGGDCPPSPLRGIPANFRLQKGRPAAPAPHPSDALVTSCTHRCGRYRWRRGRRRRDANRPSAGCDESSPGRRRSRGSRTGVRRRGSASGSPWRIRNEASCRLSRWESRTLLQERPVASVVLIRAQVHYTTKAACKTTSQSYDAPNDISTCPMSARGLRNGLPRNLANDLGSRYGSYREEQCLHMQAWDTHTSTRTI